MAIPNVRIILEAVDKTGDAFKSAGDKTDGFKDKMKAVGTAIAAVSAALGVGAFFKHAIENALEAEDAYAALEQVVQSTGGAAGFTAEQLRDQADALAKLSNFSSEAIQGGLARLLTYTDIQGESFLHASKAALDMAAFLKIDVASAAEKVGNALNYPSEAINSLTKQGFRFTDQQKAQIKHFEETNQIAKAQAIILGELDLAYGDQAAKGAATFRGKLIDLKEGFGDILEAVGTAIIKNRDLGAGMDGLVGVMANVAKFIETNSGAFDELGNRVIVIGRYFYDLGATVVEATTKAIAPMVDFIVRNSEKFKELGQIVVDTGKVVLEFAVKVLKNVLSPAFAALNLALNPVREMLLNGLVIAFRLVKFAVTEVALGFEGFAAVGKIALGTIMEGIGNLAKIGTGILKKFGIDIGDGLATDFRDAGGRMVAEGKESYGRLNTAVKDAAAELITGRKQANATESQVMSDHHADMLADTKQFGKNTNAAVAAMTEEQEKLFKKGFEAEEKRLASLRTGREQLADAYKKVYGEVLPPLVKKVSEAITAAQKAEVEGDAEARKQKERLIATWDALIPALTDVEDLRSRINKLDKDPVPLSQLIAMQKELDGYQKILEKLPPETELHVELSGVLLALQEKLGAAAVELTEQKKKEAKVWNEIRQTETTVAELQKDLTERAEKHREKVEAIARGTVSTLEGMGLINDEAANLLNNFINIATAAPKFFTDPTAAFQAIGALTGILGSVFGDSPADKARKELIRKNTEALEELARSNKGLMEVQSGAATFSGIQKALTAAVGEGGSQADIEKRLLPLLAKSGIKPAELMDLAKQLGIDMNGPDAFKRLLVAMQTVGGSVFGTDFSGEMERLQRAFEATGEDDPMKKFAAISDALSRFGGAGVGALFEGDVLQNLAGVITGASPQELLALAGGLSPTEFLDVLQDLIDLLNEAAPPDEAPSFAPPSAASAMPDVGGLISAPLNESPVSLPTLGDKSGGGGRGGPLVQIDAINIEVGADVDPERAIELGRKIAAGMVDELDEQFGQKLSLERFLQGVGTID